MSFPGRLTDSRTIAACAASATTNSGPNYTTSRDVTLQQAITLVAEPVLNS